MVNGKRVRKTYLGKTRKEHWRQIRSNNPQERLNKEIRRRTWPDPGRLVHVI